MKTTRCFFSALDRLLKPQVPRGFSAGQVVWPKDWTTDDKARILGLPVVGLPVVKPRLDNPLLPPRKRDWTGLLGGTIVTVLSIAVIAMFVGSFLEDDPFMFLRDLGWLGSKRQ